MTTKEKIEVMQAYADGKGIQHSWKNKGSWIDVVNEPIWDWEAFDYRIKPEPTYIPYNNASEVKKYKWVRDKKTEVLYRVSGIDAKNNMICLDFGWIGMEYLFEYYIYEDGTPCGKLVVK